MIVQLNPPVALETPKGAGLAHLAICNDDALFWQVFIEGTGESCLFDNKQITKAGAKPALRDEEKRDAFYARLKVGNFVV